MKTNSWMRRALRGEVTAVDGSIEQAFGAWMRRSPHLPMTLRPGSAARYLGLTPIEYRAWLAYPPMVVAILAARRAKLSFAGLLRAARQGAVCHAGTLFGRPVPSPARRAVNALRAGQGLPPRSSFRRRAA